MYASVKCPHKKYKTKIFMPRCQDHGGRKIIIRESNKRVIKILVTEKVQCDKHECTVNSFVTYY